MIINQVAVIGAFDDKELRAIVVKNGDTHIYKVETMSVDEIADFLKELSQGNTDGYIISDKGTNE